MLFVLAALMTSIPSGVVYAFHEGGKDFCKGCHVVRKSRGRHMQDRHHRKGSWKLKGFDPSSTCLRCHAVDGKFYNVLSSDGSSYSAGGDFYWLKKTFTWIENGKLYQSAGNNHGHNVTAAEYGLHEENPLGSAPGSIFSSTAVLGCTSCHDPHSRTVKDGYTGEIPVSDSSYGHDFGIKFNVGNYRLLRGIGYTGGKQAGGVFFQHPAPVAAANPQNWVETDSNHTAYGSGMSEWCSNCHPDFLTGNDKHPVGNDATLSSTIASNYNSYVKTGDITGTKTAAYLALVPFESGTADTLSLDPSSASGPAQGANVICLTCHRAHASAFQDIGRWDFETTFVADSHPQPGDGGAAGNDVRNSYYGRDMVSEFGLNQRWFCNKCHLLD